MRSPPIERWISPDLADLECPRWEAGVEALPLPLPGRLRTLPHAHAPACIPRLCLAKPAFGVPDTLSASPLLLGTTPMY